MNSLNPLELEKWKPRPPSPKVYARIFGHEPEGDLVFHLRDLSRWLVPAFGCFLLVMGSLSTHLPAHYSAIDTNFALPALTDDMSVATLPGVQQHSGVNCYPAQSYEWSFGARASTAALGAGSYLFSYTNKLIQK